MKKLFLLLALLLPSQLSAQPEVYLETNQNFSNKKKFLISVDRVYLLFFCFFSLISIFAFKIIRF